MEKGHRCGRDRLVRRRRSNRPGNSQVHEPPDAHETLERGATAPAEGVTLSGKQTEGALMIVGRAPNREVPLLPDQAFNGADLCAGIYCLPAARSRRPSAPSSVRRRA